MPSAEEVSEQDHMDNLDMCMPAYMARNELTIWRAIGLIYDGNINTSWLRCKKN